MHAVVVPVLYHLLLLLAGLGVLRLAGVRARGAGNAIALTGLAYLVGISAVFATIELLLVLGVPFGLPSIAVVALAYGAPWLATVPASLRAARLPSPRQVAAYPVVAGVVLAGVWLLVFVHQLDAPLSRWDAWSDWTYKARIFAGLHQIPTALFQAVDRTTFPGLGPGYPISHFDYPLTLPLWEAGHFRALGRTDTSQVLGILMLWVPAWIGGMVALAPRRTSKLVVYPVVVGTALLLMPYLQNGYADGPLAAVMSLGVLALGRWLLERHRSDLILAVVLLGGAATLKNEGIVGGVVIFASLLVALWRDRPAQRTALLAGGAWLAGFVLPWKLWLLAHGVHGDLPFGKLVDPVYVVDRLDRTKQIFTSIASGITGYPDLGVVVFVVAGVLLVAKGPSRPVRAFVSLAVVLYALTLLSIYYVTSYDLHWILVNSTSRTLIVLNVIGVSGILLLCTPPAPPGGPEPSGEALADEIDRDLEAMTNLTVL